MSDRPDSTGSAANEPPQDSYIAVTGAAGSVGPAMAAAFLQRGWRVAMLTRPGREGSALDKLAELDAAHDDDRVAAFGANLDEPRSAIAAVSAADERFGHPAALLNLAGGFTLRPATESGLDDVDAMMAKNFRSAVVATKAVLPSMRARGGGFVLAMGAGAATQAAPGRTAYAAAKAALAAYFRSLSAELKGTGIGAGILHPMGTIDTPPNRQAMPNADFSSWIGVDAVVEAALYLMAASTASPQLAPTTADAIGTGHGGPLASRGRVPELELYPGR
ncbi:MAG TPA: SDR family NAD(P)-dependent oxidoreductase [Trueperaceae bacterium]|nr:SDR family NAD(P)-dependent oxidoreductase [Trueperaceae bacterium]